MNATVFLGVMSVFCMLRMQFPATEFMNVHGRVAMLLYTQYECVYIIEYTLIIILASSSY